MLAAVIALLTITVSLGISEMAKAELDAIERPDDCHYFIDYNLGAGNFGEDGGVGDSIENIQYAAFGKLGTFGEGRILKKEAGSWKYDLNLTGSISGANDNRTVSLHALSLDNVWAGLSSVAANQGAARERYGWARWNGASWGLVNVTFHTGKPVTQGVLMRGLWGATANDIWSADAENAGSLIDRIYRWNGTAFNRYPAAPSFLGIRDMDGSANNNIWAVGGDGGATPQVVRWDGNTWTAIAFPAAHTLFGVYVNNAQDVWVSGRSGTVYQWNGSVWINRAPGTGFNILDVFGARGVVYAAGSGNTIFRWDGTSWEHIVNIQGGIGDLRRGWVSDYQEGHIFTPSYIVGSDGIIAIEKCNTATGCFFCFTPDPEVVKDFLFFVGGLLMMVGVGFIFFGGAREGYGR